MFDALKAAACAAKDANRPLVVCILGAAQPETVFPSEWQLLARAVRVPLHLLFVGHEIPMDKHGQTANISYVTGQKTGGSDAVPLAAAAAQQEGSANGTNGAAANGSATGEESVDAVATVVPRSRATQV